MLDTPPPHTHTHTHIYIYIIVIPSAAILSYGNTAFAGTSPDSYCAQENGRGNAE